MCRSPCSHLCTTPTASGATRMRTVNPCAAMWVGCVRGVALLPAAACGVLYLHILSADLIVIAIASFYQVSCVMCVRHMQFMVHLVHVLHASCHGSTSDVRRTFLASFPLKNVLLLFS